MRSRHYLVGLAALHSCIVLVFLLAPLARAAVPGRPTGLSVIPGNTEASLTWAPVVGAGDYVVYRTDDLDEPYDFVGRTRVNCFADTRLGNGTTYYYVVTATNGEGQGPESGRVQVIPTVTALVAPEDIQTHAGNGEVSLTWSAVTSAVEYTVLRINPSGQIVELTPAAPGLSFTDRTVVNGATYHYVIQTMSTNPSSYSYTVAAKPSANLPKAPGAVTTDPGSEWTGVAWAAVPGASRYMLHRSEGIGGPFEFRAMTGTTSFEDTDLDNEQSYYYIVTAVNANGQSAFSPVAGAAVSALKKPKAATLTGRPRTGGAYLNWAGSSGALSYTIFRSTTQGAYDFSSPIETTTDSYLNDSGITNGTNYYYVVRSHNASSTQPISNELRVRPSASLTAPTNVVVIPGNTQATVTFAPVEGATGYTVEVAETEGGSYYKRGTATEDRLSYTFTELTNGQNYYFRVRTSTSISSDFSGEVRKQPSAGLPLAPGTISGMTGNTQVSLRWDPVVGATGYRVFRRTASTIWQQVSAAPLPGSYFQDTGLTNGTKYYYNVAAINGNGTGAWAPTAVNFTPSATYNLAPTGIVVTPGNTQAGITWQAVPGATRGYAVEIATQPGGPAIKKAHGIGLTNGVGTASYTATDLTNGQDYYFRVQLYYGRSMFSADYKVTPSVTRPQAPVSVGGDIWSYAGNTQTSMRWTPVLTASGYRVYRRTATGKEPSRHIATVAIPFFTDFGLENGTTYHYNIAAVNSYGVGPLMTREVSLTPLASRNLVPANLAGIPGNTQLTAIWDPVAGATGYLVRIATNPGGSRNDESVSPYNGQTSGTGYDLTNGQTYHVRVQTQRPALSAEYGVVSITPSVRLPMAPERVGCLAPGNTQATLRWDSVDNAYAYNIYRRSEARDSTTTLLGSSSASLFTDTGLTNETKYYYTVAAVNSQGEGAWSYYEAYCTPNAEKPLAPTSLSAVAGNGQISLRWNARAGVTRYRVLQAESSGGPYRHIAVIDEPSYVATDLQNGRLYYFCVQAENSVNETSAYSAEVYSLSSDMIADTDHDGIADDWERVFFNSLATCDSQSDYENDGYTDLREYLNWRSNLADPTGNQYDPTAANAPNGYGFGGGSGSSILNLIMSVISNNTGSP